MPQGALDTPPRYDRAFYEEMARGSECSAAEIVPTIVDLVNPRHVVDIGCGVGTWLKAFQEAGVTEIVGVDGRWVRRGALQIPESCFHEVDLNQPFTLDQRRDLAVCLEVAEHLPQEAASRFVASLVRLAPIVVFSAAVPGQTGVHHVNEQWPDYWVQLFAQHDYTLVDCLRRRFWDNPRIDYWYAQNMLLFVEAGRLKTLPSVRAELERSAGQPLCLVHPRAFSRIVSRYQELRTRGARALPLRTLIAALSPVLCRFFKRIWRKRWFHLGTAA